MKFRSHEPSSVDVDLTSMIDVVFLLLIFFMVTTTFNHNSALKIALPTASKNPETQNIKNTRSFKYPTRDTVPSHD